MRVFVVGTGRCGTVSFKEACKFITNYTAGHETVSFDLEYLDNHVEVNPHFHARLTTVVTMYPTAKWVHLTRLAEPCIESLAAMDEGGVMLKLGAMYPSLYPAHDPPAIAARFYHDINARIAATFDLLLPPSQRMLVRLENVKSDFKRFWDWIDAEGDLESALKSWDTPHNVRKPISLEQITPLDAPP